MTSATSDRLTDAPDEDQSDIERTNAVPRGLLYPTRNRPETHSLTETTEPNRQDRPAAETIERSGSHAREEHNCRVHFARVTRRPKEHGLHQDKPRNPTDRSLQGIMRG